MNKGARLRGGISCFLKTQNDPRYSLLFAFVNREAAVWHGGDSGDGEEDIKKKKKKTSFSLIWNQKAFSHSLCAPHGHSEPVSMYIRLGHFDEIKAQASLWLNRMGALTQPVSD